MKLGNGLVALLWAACAAVVVGALLIAARYTPGRTLLDVFMDAALLTKLAMTTAALALLVVLVFAAVGFLLRTVRGDAGWARVGLYAIGGIGLAMGALGAAWTLLLTKIAEAEVGGPSFAVTAPSYLEVLASLGLGLFVAALAVTAARLTAARPSA